VRAEEDKGYHATSTLAGTRLRSDLQDLAASISVVTRDFMSDVNATDLTSLLVYTLGTEVGGFGGNFSDLSNPEAQGVFDDALGQASPGTRIRGLIHADRTRNYFLTDIPLDGYNVERVEISRGANASLFGLGSPAGIINSSLIRADARKNATTVRASFGSYGSYRGTLDHNHVLRPDRLALRLATVYDDTRYRTEFAYERKKAVTLTGIFRPTPQLTMRATSELGRSDSNRPEQRPPFDRLSWWWAAGKPVWNPAAPGGGAGRLLATPQAPFTANTVFTATGARQIANYLTANWSGSAPNEPMLVYLDPNRGTPGGLQIGGRTVDGFKSFAENSALNADGTALVGSGMVGLNSRLLIEQNVFQAGNPLRTLFSREPMLSDPAIFDFHHAMLGGPTKYEFAWWEAHNLTLEHTFLDRRAGIEVSLDRQRIDNGFTSPVSYSVNLDPNERLPNGAPNPNFLRPVTIGSGFKRIYSQDRDAARATGYYRLDLRGAGNRTLGRALGRHLFNANYSRDDFLYQQFGGTLWNNDLDWRAFEGFTTPGTASSTARIVPLVRYLGPSLQGAASPRDARVQGLTAVQDPSGIGTITILTNQRPTSAAPSALNPWAPATFGLVGNGRYDVRNTIRNAQRYSDRLEQQVRSLSTAVQSHWLDDNLVTTVGWRRDQVWSFDAGIPGQTPRGTADVGWDVFPSRLTRTLSESSVHGGVVGHLPAAARLRLRFDGELSAFYNYASNFRVAPQRYTITSVALPSETGETREYGVRLTAFNGRFDLRLARFATEADNATVSGLTAGLNQLAMVAAQVIDHNFLGNNAGNPAGIAAFEAWLDSPYGRTYREAFSAQLLPNTDPARPAAQFGRYADASGDRGQIHGVSALKSTGYELELGFNPTVNWRISANAASAEAVRTRIAPELHDFIFNPNGGLLSLVQNADGTPTPAGQLIGTPLGAGAAPLQTFIAGNVLNLGVATTFAQDGTKTDELRKWNFRAVTNYTFSADHFDGRLKGVSAGGAVRWSDAPLLGYAGQTITRAGSALAVSDITRPFLGPRETTFDAWIGYSRTLRNRIRWKLQLNVRNIGVGNELRPLAVWPDGTVVQWTIREPQRWTMTNSFSF
jgi:outer membrane receptor protein involved in Fe transport